MPRGIPGSGGGKYGLTIQANVKGQQNIKRLGNSMQGVQGQAKNLAMSFKGLVGPLVALGSATAVFKTLSTSFRVLAEREADFATLANGLTRVSTDAPKAAKALRAMADELGFETLFDEKAFQKGFALLTSFKNIGIESYGRVAETAADLAQINQVDLKSSFLQLAKALSDPTRGLTALSRSGVIFTETQREMILELHKSGQEMEAQAAILKIVEGSYKGAARSAAEGLAGAFDTLGQKVRDFNEALGGAADPFMEPLVEATTEVFDVVTDGLNAISDDMVVFAKNIEIALKPVFKWIITNLENMFKWFDQVFATQRNLAAIQVKTGDEFQKVRKELMLDAKGLKSGNLFTGGLDYGANTKAIDRAKELAGTFTEKDFQGVLFPDRSLLGKEKNWKPFLQEAINEIFQENVEEYVENVLGMKAVKPDIDEVTLTFEDQITTLEGLKGVTDDAGESLEKTFGEDFKSKIDAFGESLQSMGEMVGDTVVRAFKGAEDALVSFVKTGKLDFKSLVDSILSDLARMAIRQSITAPLFNAFSSALSGGLGGGTTTIRGSVQGSGLNALDFDDPAASFFSSGGYVNRPTLGMIGEGGESEVVIPQSKLASAMARYQAGARGGAIVPGGNNANGGGGSGYAGGGNVTVNYQGDILNFEGQNYVKQSDVGGIISAAANAGEARTMKTLKNSRSQRAMVGL